INSLAGACGTLDVQKLDDNTAFMLLPRQYFNTTWEISLLTYLIRVSNVSVVIEDWFKHPTLSVDNPFKAHFNGVMKHGFNPPVKNLKSYVYFGKKQSLDGQYDSTFHNNGCYNWMSALEFGY